MRKTIDWTRAIVTSDLDYNIIEYTTTAPNSPIKKFRITSAIKDHFGIFTLVTTNKKATIDNKIYKTDPNKFMELLNADEATLEKIKRDLGSQTAAEYFNTETIHMGLPPK